MINNILLEPTPKSWTAHIIKNFEPFLLDHAACEKKAAALALSFVAKYPDHTELVSAMINLSIEELQHFKELVEIINEKGMSLATKDYKDTYVNTIIKANRHGKKEKLLDKLVSSSLIEARGHERFTLLAHAIEDPCLKKLYQRLANEEAGHHQIFIRLAKQYFNSDQVIESIKRLSIVEAEAMLASPLSHRLH